jgi:hypothetical protein
VGDGSGSSVAGGKVAGTAVASACTTMGAATRAAGVALVDSSAAGTLSVGGEAGAWGNDWGAGVGVTAGTQPARVTSRMSISVRVVLVAMGVDSSQAYLYCS